MNFNVMDRNRDSEQREKLLIAWGITATLLAGVAGVCLFLERRREAPEYVGARIECEDARPAPALQHGDSAGSKHGAGMVRDLALRTEALPDAQQLIKTLGGMKTPEAAEALAHIYTNASGKHVEFLKKDAASRLAEIGGQAAENQLSALYQQERDPKFKDYLLSRLKLVATPATLETIGPPQSNNDRRREEAIAETVRISKLDSQRDTDLEELQRTFEEGGVLAHRLSALHRIARRGDDQAAETLLALYEKEADPQVKLNVLASLARTGSPRSREGLERLLHSSDEATCLTVIGVLGQADPAWGLKQLKAIDKEETSPRILEVAGAARRRLQMRLARKTGK